MKKFPLWLSILVIVAIAGAAFWGRWSEDNKVKSISSFEECAALYPVLESYPEQCNTPDGQHFVHQVPPIVPPGDSGGGERVAAGYVAGKVSIGPICPVEREDMPCKPTPEMFTSREVVVYRSDKTTVAARDHLNGDGTYKVALGPGNYFIQISPAGIGSGEMKPATVISFQTTTVDFDIDTGIR